MSARTKWTPEEEEQVLRAVKDSPDNLQRAFDAASHAIGRTKGACEGRWYTVISKRRDSQSIALLCVSKKTYGVNRKNCRKHMETTERGRFSTVWSRLVNFFAV